MTRREPFPSFLGRVGCPSRSPLSSGRVVRVDSDVFPPPPAEALDDRGHSLAESSSRLFAEMSRLLFLPSLGEVIIVDPDFSFCIFMGSTFFRNPRTAPNFPSDEKRGRLSSSLSRASETNKSLFFLFFVVPLALDERRFFPGRFGKGSIWRSCRQAGSFPPP